MVRRPCVVHRNWLTKFIPELKKERLKAGRGGNVDLLIEDPEARGGSFLLSYFFSTDGMSEV